MGQYIKIACLLIISIIICLSCKVQFKNDSLISKYIDHTGNILYDSAILNIMSDQIFYYHHWHAGIIGFKDCDTVFGYWKFVKGKLILRSEKFKEQVLIDAYRAENLTLDSIDLEFINYSDASPSHQELILLNEKDEILEVITDQDGHIRIPAGYNFFYFHNYLGSPTKLYDNLKGGWYYKFRYYDCYPITIDYRFKVINDTLINLRPNDVSKMFQLIR